MWWRLYFIMFLIMPPHEGKLLWIEKIRWCWQSWATSVVVASIITYSVLPLSEGQWRTVLLRWTNWNVCCALISNQYSLEFSRSYFRYYKPTQFKQIAVTVLSVLLRKYEIWTKLFRIKWSAESALWYGTAWLNMQGCAYTYRQAAAAVHHH